jgi:hypothetical protein
MEGHDSRSQTLSSLLNRHSALNTQSQTVVDAETGEVLGEIEWDADRIEFRDDW